jgi:hypothetical protein
VGTCLLLRRYPVTAAYIYLLRICCLAANVVSLFVSEKRREEKRREEKRREEKRNQ